MKIMTWLAAILAAGLIGCTPATAQKTSALPAATSTSAADITAVSQGSGCATQTSPCMGAKMTLSQIAGYVAVDPVVVAAYQPLITLSNAPLIRSTLGLGTNSTDSIPRAQAGRIITTTAPLTGGGDLTADRTIAITPATGTAAGSMSAADKAKLDGIAAGATANTGTVTTVSATGANGIGVTVTNGGTTPAIAITAATLTPTTVAATGTVTGLNLSGTNTGDQTITLTGDATGTGKGSFAVTLATVPVAKGGTGDTGTAWTAYTPTLAASSGTFTTASASGRYKTLGKTVLFSVTVTITTNGSAAGYWTFTLPVTATAAAQQVAFGKETAVVGSSAIALTTNSGAAMLVQRFDASYLGGNGYVIVLQGSYEAS